MYNAGLLSNDINPMTLENFHNFDLHPFEVTNR